MTTASFRIPRIHQRPCRCMLRAKRLPEISQTPPRRYLELHV